MFISLVGLGIGMLFTNFHVCRMVLVFNAMLYMVVNYAGPKELCVFCRCCIIFTLSGHVEWLFCFIAS